MISYDIPFHIMFITQPGPGGKRDLEGARNLRKGSAPERSCNFYGCTMGVIVIDPPANKKRWKDPPWFMGKSSISMAISIANC